MLSSALLAFAHHLAAFALTAALVYVWALFHPDLSLARARRLRRADLVYGISAVMVLLIGLARVVWTEKGLDFYLANGFFYTKLVLFLGVGVLSLYPTLHFLSWRPPLKRNETPVVDTYEYGIIKWCLRLELLCLAGILLCAAMMARGMGHY